ncbi:MAG: hypothetical protein ACJ8ER_15265 [Allosphingosinicella sp.]
MKGSPPLRFLALLVGGWTALRAAFLAPMLWAPPSGAAERNGPRTPRIARSAASRAVAANAVPAVPAAPLRAPLVRFEAPRSPAKAGAQSAPRLSWAPAFAGEPRYRDENLPLPALPARHGAFSAQTTTPKPGGRRWSLSTWAFVRRGDGAPLAAGGTLGGSQAGARFLYRLSEGVSLSARLSSPMRTPAGAEAALGLDWRPARALPVHLLAERRQALGRDARSAFALAAYGGLDDAPLGPLRLDAYGQAGLVGTRSRELFADGALRLSLPLGRTAKLGAGAWAAAQPGVSRVDAGPQASVRTPIAGRSITVMADWRFRLAGQARPGSGPTLTIATDF